MTQYRVGIVGCGEAAQILHLPSLYQLQDKFTVTALCDASQTVVDGVGDVWRVSNRFLDYRDLVGRSDVDIVLIANPNAYHAEVALAAIEAGKHVLVEKPMCITLRENDAIIAARDKAGVVVQVGTMRRYAPAFIDACERVRKLDNICLARVHDVIGRNAQIIEPTSRVVRGKDIPQAALAATSAKNDELVKEAVGDVPSAVKTSYNLLLGLSSHDTSAMRELLGMPKGVLYAAQRQNGIYMTAAFDYGSYVCHFETGVDVIPRFDACLEVYSAEQVVRVDYDTPYVRNLPIRLRVTAAEGVGAAQHDIHPAWGDAFTLEWEAFYDNITQKKLPKTSPEDFRQDLELYARMIQLMC
jgi:predicted dehydrogenase